MSSSHRSGSARRWIAVTAAVLCVGAALPPTSAQALPAAPGHAASAPAAADGTHTVTLLTGDQVRYRELPGGRAQVTVQPGTPERTGVTFATTSQRAAPGGPALYVVPSDADPLLTAGVLDRELFNVRGLSRQGLDDSRAATLPIIVSHPRTRELAALPGSKRTRELAAVRGSALRVERRGSGFWKAISAGRGRAALSRGVGKVWLDARVTVSLDHSVPQIGAPEAWQAGYDGRGVKVAILDTGVDAGHPDLKGRIAASADFTGSGSTQDGHGHGTHVASIIAGSGAASGGRLRGVAPGAQLMIGRVLDDDGAGLDSMVIEGMQWAAGNGARVINMSLGGEPTDGTDPLSAAVDELSRETGALFVVAAGNDGAPVSVNTPGAARSALTVGAVDRDDHVAAFSSKGPRLGDGLIKPEIVAPGVGIVAARAAGTELGDPVDDSYTALSGTSMATPHVAGAAAILAQRRPAWRGDRLKDALINSAAPVDGSWSAIGAGRVDVARAVRQDIAATGSLQADGGGTPGTDVTEYPVSYVNDGTEPLNLHLGVTFTGWNGASAPALGRLSTTDLAVPAGGRATVTLTIDAAAAGGAYGGAVTATGPQVSLRTAVSVYVRPETSQVTVRMTDHHGEPVPYGTAYLVDADLDPATSNDPFATPTVVVPVEEGSAVVPVRRGGVYTAMASLSSAELTGRRTDVMVSPEISVNGDTEITLDARKGQRHTVTTGEATDELARALEVVRTSAGAQMSLLAAVRNDPDLQFFVTPQQAARHGSLDTYDKRTLATAGLRVRAESGSAAVDLHPRYDVYRTPARWAGTRQADLIWAGRGRPEDLAGLDLHDRLALVALAGDGDDPVATAAQAATAATRAVSDAGAAGVLLYVDRPGAVPLSRPAATPVPQLFLGQQEGAGLRSWLTSQAVRVTLTGDDSPDSNYNLFYPADGVPSGRTDAATAAGLVTIPTRYHAGSPMTYEKNWYAFGPRSVSAVRERVQFAAPAVRTEYVGPANPGVSWIRWTTQNEQPANSPALTSSLISRDVFGTGTRSLPEERWFEGPILEGEPEGATDGCGLCRGGPDGAVFYPAWHLRDSADTHAIQSWPDYRSSVRLFRDDTEVPAEEQTNGLPMPTFRLPAQPATYRLEVDGPTPAGPGVRPVQHTTSQWSFRSAPPQSPALPCPGAVTGGCASQPLIQLTYRLGLDPANRAPAGRDLAFEVLAREPQKAENGGALAGLWIWSSADAGKTWRPATVRQVAPGRYGITVRNPAAAGSDGMWLKAEAWDSAGNRLQQTVRGAYALADPARAPQLSR